MSSFNSAKPMKALGLVGVLALASLGLSSCSFSFCAGSGCDAGKITFGTNFKQSSGNISVVGKRSTFTIGQSVAMVAKLSESAKTRVLTLKVSSNGRSQAVPYHVSGTGNNIFANVFTPTDLSSLGISTPGTYKFQMLRGSKQLASGSMTEK